MNADYASVVGTNGLLGGISHPPQSTSMWRPAQSDSVLFHILTETLARTGERR